MSTLLAPFRNLSRSFLVRPDITFTTQHEGEHVVLVVRKHPLTQLIWIINSFILIAILGTAGILLPDFLSPSRVFAIQIFGFCFIFSYIWINFLLWYFTVGIVTNERAIDLDFYNVIYKEFSATTIRQVSDLTTKIGGLLGTLFDFGSVYVKTEGFEQNIEFESIPKPSEVVKIINILMRDANQAGDEG